MQALTAGLLYQTMRVSVLLSQKCKFHKLPILSQHSNLLNFSEKCRRVQMCSYLEMWRPQSFSHWFPWLLPLSFPARNAELARLRPPAVVVTPSRPRHLRGFFLARPVTPKRMLSFIFLDRTGNRMAGGSRQELKYKNQLSKKKEAESLVPLSLWKLSTWMESSVLLEPRTSGENQVKRCQRVSTALKTSIKKNCPHHPLALTIGSCKKKRAWGGKWSQFHEFNLRPLGL